MLKNFTVCSLTSNRTKVDTCYKNFKQLSNKRLQNTTDMIFCICELGVLSEKEQLKHL